MSQRQLNTVLHHVRRLVGETAETTDRELLDRFLDDRDEAAFRDLLQRHGPMVLGVCRRLLGNGHDAEDAFQATFLVLAGKAATVRHGQALGSWLYQVAYHVSIKARARSARRSEAQSTTAVAASPDTTEDVAWRDLRPVLDEELNRLPSVYRQPVILCYLEGLTQEQVARQLGWTKGTVSGRLARARQMLQARLTRRGVALSAALGAGLASVGAARAAPRALVESTTRIASLFAAGHLALAGTSPAVVLAQGALANMFRARLAATVAVLVVLFGGLIGGGRLLCQVPERPRGPEQAEKQAERVSEGQGDPLPEGVLHRLGTARLHHAHNVLGIAFAPDGKTLASVGSDHLARLWDAATGKEIRTFGEEDKRRDPYTPARWIGSLAFSPDGKLLATGEYGSIGSTARVWDVATGKKLHEFTPHRGGVPSLAFSPDSKLLATCGAGDGAILLWDLDRGREWRTILTELQTLRTVAFWDGGRRVVARAGDGTLRSWEAETGRPVGADKESVEGLAVSPDGTLFALADGFGTVRLWDPVKNREVRSFEAGEQAVRCLAFSPDGKYLSAGASDRSVRLWEVATGKQLRSVVEQPNGIQAVAAAPGGTLFAWTNTDDNAFYLRDAAKGKDVVAFGGHRGIVRPLQWSDDGKMLLSSGRDRTIRRWDPATGRQLSLHRGAHYTDHSACFAADGKTAIYGSGQGIVAILDLDSGKEMRRLTGLESVVLSTTLTPDGRLAAGLDSAGSLIVWDATTGKERLRKQVGEQVDYSNVLRLSPDGRYVLLGGVNSPGRLLRVEDGKWTELDSETSAAHSSTFSPDGNLLATGAIDGAARLWDTATGKLVRALPGHPGYILSLAFSADGRTLAAGSWRSVRLWEVASGRPRGSFREVEGDVFALAFSRDGRTLACGCGDSTILLWDVTNAAKGIKQMKRERLWEDLTAEDGEKAYRAAWALAATPDETLARLRKSLKPAPAPADAKEVARLVRDLDGDDFAVREKASAELEKLGPAAEGALRKALGSSSAAEVQRRVRSLLEKIEVTRSGQEWVVTLRQLELLEHLGSADASKFAEELTRGDADAALTREATLALSRMSRPGKRAP